MKNNYFGEAWLAMAAITRFTTLCCCPLRVAFDFEPVVGKILKKYSWTNSKNLEICFMYIKL